MDSLLIAFLAGLGAMLGWGIADFFGKKAVDEIGDIPVLFWANFFGLVPLFIYIPFSNLWRNFPYEQLPYLAILAFFSLAIFYFFYRAIKRGKLSIISPINASYPIFSTLVSVFLFREQLSSGLVLILLGIMAGILLTSLDIKGILKDGFDKEDFSKGVPSILLNVAILAFWLPAWDHFISDKSWLMSLFLLRLISVIYLLFYLGLTKTSVRITRKFNWGWLVFIGLLNLVAGTSMDWGFGVTTHTSLITVLSATFFIPTLLLSRFFLKEKLQATQWMGVGLILLSLVALGIA